MNTIGGVPMNTYSKCNKCGHQVLFTGAVKTVPCPACGSESWIIQMGGPKPDWWKSMTGYQCPHPEQCAIEAGWMYNPNIAGWSFLIQNVVNGRQAEGYAWPRPIGIPQIYGNTFVGAPKAIVINTANPTPKTIWQRIAEWFI